MRIVWPLKSLSVARACARVDSGLDKAKICSDRRIDADRPRLRVVFGGGKTFLHSLGQNRKSSMRAYVFRCSPNNGHRQDTLAGPFRASSDRRTAANLSLFDHLLGAA